MRILVTGGNGSVGRELVPALLASGHRVVVLDKDLAALEAMAQSQLELVRGSVEDRAAVEAAARGAEAIVHLAWSFSDDPQVLLEQDLRGHLLLLAAARAQKVRHFIYTSSAVVYGKPARAPIDEEHPLRVLEARKPAYGIAKEFAEKLIFLAVRSEGVPATVFRFWWVFGDTIGGKHLRQMLRAAAAGEPVAVPAACGGSFLTQEDFCQAVELVLAQTAAAGEAFNLASAYVTWEEVAGMVLAAVGSRATAVTVPPEEWRGAPFLADRWEMDDRRIRAALGFKPGRDPQGVREALRRAIARTWRAVLDQP
jgi:UDP-glucose 4-epimerase